MRERITSQLRDPRLFQLAVLGSLLGYGALALDFEVEPRLCGVIAATALATQLGIARVSGLAFDARSALVSALSLCLLLRTTSATTAALAAAIAIGSKLLIRYRGKHLLNPTAFGLAAVLLLRDDAWVSAGQWGSAPVLAAFVACLGSLVIRRAERSDVTWAFLVTTAALLLGRALWLGDPMAIPLHALESGALLIFAFFMVSDPRTTPDSRAARIAFAGLVAMLGFVIRYGLYETNGLIWALVLCAPLVPLLDRVLPGRRFEWGGRHGPGAPIQGGRHDDAQADPAEPGEPGEPGEHGEPAEPADLGPVLPGLGTAA